jgi:hypothetical protein
MMIVHGFCHGLDEDCSIARVTDCSQKESILQNQRMCVVSMSKYCSPISVNTGISLLFCKARND